MNKPEAPHATRAYRAEVSPRRVTQHASFPSLLAFTVVEMIVVTGIIALLAALIFPVAAAANRTRYLKRTRAEVTLVATAIQGYYDKLGHYPPDNAATIDTALRYMYNPLCYELRGTLLTNGVYQTLDGGAQVVNSPAVFMALFGRDAVNQPVVGGFINCRRGAGGDEAQPAIKFLPELKAGNYVDISVAGNPCRLLGSAMDGPSAVVDPTTSRKFSPFWYNCSSPTNNAKSFDLWVDVQIGSKVYRIGNWSTSFQVIP